MLNFLVSLERKAAAKHNGADEIRISEWDDGADFPNRWGTAYRFIRGNKVHCPFCNTDEEMYKECEHAAIIKTSKRQGFITERVYTLENGVIGYWKNGKHIILSTVDRVNRTQNNL